MSEYHTKSCTSVYIILKGGMLLNDRTEFLIYVCLSKFV